MNMKRCIGAVIVSLILSQPLRAGENASGSPRSSSGSDSTVGEMWSDTKSAATQFKKGYQQSGGHVGDRVIEGVIQSATPEADEATRKVQRDAVKFAVDPNSKRSQQHLDNMMQNTREMAGGEGNEQTRPSNPSYSTVHARSDSISIHASASNMNNWEPRGESVTASSGGLVIHSTSGYWDTARNQAGATFLLPLQASTRIRVRIMTDHPSNVAAVYWGELGNTQDCPYPVNGLAMEFSNGRPGCVSGRPFIDGTSGGFVYGPAILVNNYYWGEFYYSRGVAYLNVYNDVNGNPGEIIHAQSEKMPSAWNDTTRVQIRITDNYQFAPRGSVVVDRIESSNP